MSFFNAPIPNFKCLARERFFYDGDESKTALVPAVAFGIVSQPGHALGLHVLTHQGAQWYGLPLHALAWKEGAPDRELRELELWDCFSFDVSVTEFPLLSGLGCRVFPTAERATCLFTIDWTHAGAEIDPGWSRLPEEHKSGHLLKLDDGNFALQPNNRLLWEEPSFVRSEFAGGSEPYRRSTRTWSVER